MWRGDQQIKPDDLKPGDELLFNLTGKTATSPGTCSDIWAGTETDKLTTETQWRKFAEFTKRRGPPDEKAQIAEMQKVPTESYGCAGVRVTFTVGNMLEDVAKEYPVQFPFRTDYGNEGLPWFYLKAGEAPPPFSEHLVFGKLVKTDAENRTGQFRMERTGDVVDFTLIPEGAVKYLNAAAELEDIPAGTRCRFHLYQDEKGAFTKASLVSDEFSALASNVITWRIEALKLREGKLHVARQIPERKNYNGDMERIPDIGRAELLVTAETRVWKAGKQAKLEDLASDDALLVNLTSEQRGEARALHGYMGRRGDAQERDRGAGEEAQAREEVDAMSARRRGRELL